MRRDKSRAQKLHARRRAEERFGLSLSNEDLSSLVASIQSGKAKHIFKQSNRISLFRVDYDCVGLYVVYDRSRKTIVTFLTEDMIGNS